jgi:hypothetical protein
MPRIMVLAERPGVPESRLVLEECMVAADLDSDRASAQLVERVGWAIVDAEQLEQAEGGRRERAAPHGGRPSVTARRGRAIRSPETHVSEMLKDGTTLAEVEDFIDRQPISEEHGAVLWLQAWAEQTDDPARQRVARVRPICNPGD